MFAITFYRIEMIPNGYDFTCFTYIIPEGV